jgi:hypothetical protein
MIEVLSNHRASAPRAGLTLIQPFHLLLLAATSLAAVAWSAGIIAGAHWDEVAEYLVLVSVYCLASAYYLVLRFKRGNFRLFDFPVFLTILGFVEFGLAPLTSLVDPGLNFFRGDFRPLHHALLYFMFGMGAFWVGSSLLRPLVVASDASEAAGAEPAPGRMSILVRAAALFVIGFLAKVYLLQSSLYSYTQSHQAYFSSLNTLEFLSTAADLGTCALLVAAIERFRRPADPTRKVLFWTVFILECSWGLISGMKYLLLRNFLFVALVSSYVEGKVRKAWIVAPFLALIAIYPFSDAYRNLVRSRVQVSSLAAAQDASSLALSESLKDESDVSGWVESGWQRTMRRLNLLQSVGIITELGPRAERLQGDERWWMVPIYPFVPRFLWPNKPLLNKAQRLSILLKLGSQTSTALTYPGDLYLQFGLPGILLGMFLLGVAGQWLANRVSGPSADRHLLVYAATFMVVADLENDAFLLWVSVIKTIVVMTLVAWLIYGPSPNSAVTLFLKRISGRRPCGC